MNGLSRRAFLLAPMLAMAVGPVRAAESPLPMPASLAPALEAALARHRALLMMVSLPGCPWCKLVRQSYLAPLLADGQPVIELDMQDQAGIVGFDGAATTSMRLADSLRVRVAPTVLFLGRAGRELAPRLTGVSSEDFYGAYLQERVDTANRAASS